MSAFDSQLTKVRSADGFIAALDQSGGSTPKALRLYGVSEDAYSGDDEMFDKIHEMRSRIVMSPAFGGDRILGAILFEKTMDREIGGKGSAQFLWENKNVVPFLKVDKGLADEANGVQLMKPMPGLDELLARAKQTRRIRHQDAVGDQDRRTPKASKAIVDQQFEIGMQHRAPPAWSRSSNPRSTSTARRKAEAETMLKAALLEHLGKLSADQHVMFKLTLPETNGFYQECIDHPNVLRVVALSGGYSRAEANERLAQNAGMIASFSRALTEGLSAQQSDEEFNSMLDDAIGSIFEASKT